MSVVSISLQPSWNRSRPSVTIFRAMCPSLSVLLNEEKNPMLKRTLSAALFSVIWQTSENLREVATRTGKGKNAVMRRAMKLRSVGVPLKRMR